VIILINSLIESPHLDAGLSNWLGKQTLQS
jgi:hypothetical protein